MFQDDLYTWLPHPAIRTYRYLVAVKTLAWDEKWFTERLEMLTGIPLYSASTATLLLGWRQVFGGWIDTKRKLRDLLESPPRRNGQGNVKADRNIDGLPVRKLHFE